MPPVGGQYQVIGISRERRQEADVVGRIDCEEQIVEYQWDYGMLG